MKILYIISNRDLDLNQNTGYARHIRETVDGLRELGYIVEIMHAQNHVYLTPSVNEIETSKRFSIKQVIPELIWETVKDLKQLKINASFKIRVDRKMAEFKPDLVYERTSYLSNTITINSKNIPWILEVNSPFVELRKKISGRSIFQFLAHRFEKEKYKLADHIFTVSTALSQFIELKYLVDPEKIEVNPNGVNPEDFDFSIEQLEKKELTFGFVGSIMEYHGVEKLIHSFSELVNLGYSARLLIVGDGHLLPDLKKLTEELNLKHNIVFTGGVSHSKVKYYLAEIDVAIMPDSNWYGSPVKLFEYGVMKKIIIAPNKPPVNEVMENEKDGFIIGSQRELTEILISLAQDSSRFRYLAENFHKKVLNHYTWKKNAERIHNIIGVHV